jgi:hypothetical protein
MKNYSLSSILLIVPVLIFVISRQLATKWYFRILGSYIGIDEDTFLVGCDTISVIV